jgi:hypothetical protein
MFVNALRTAGTDEAAFTQAFAALQAAKVSAKDLAQIAREFCDTVTKYKNKASAFADIRKVFIRRARFAQKIA